MSTIGRRYGFIPSLPSINRPRFVGAGLSEAQLPTSVDLAPQFPACYDQGGIGSCTANAVAGLVQRYLMQTHYKWAFTPSRLFLYYNSRSLEGTVDTDSGVSITDAVKSANQFGACPETEADGTTPDWVWSYDDGSTKFKTKPPEACYKDAVLHKALTQMSVNLDRNTVLNTLAAGEPFVFGFTVHQSFESADMAKTGIMHVPQAFDISDPEIGGHGVDAVGYLLNTPMGDQGVVDWVKVRNSWSPGWGLDGYFWAPLDQIICNSQVASDAHIIQIVGA